jgi:type I restriction enzyme S subunit
MQLTIENGQLPVGWEIKTLGEVCNISTGKLNANAAVENGQYPFFTCSREIFTIDHFAFDCEAILLAGNNAVGDFNVKHYKGKFNAYQRTYVITNAQKRRVTFI